MENFKSCNPRRICIFGFSGILALCWLYLALVIINNAISRRSKPEKISEQNNFEWQETKENIHDQILRLFKDHSTLEKNENNENVTKELFEEKKDVFQERFDPFALSNKVLWDRSFSTPKEDQCLKASFNSRLLEKIVPWGGSTRNEPKILCSIYTYHKNHDTNVKATRETWASRCDGFIAFSDQNDAKIPTFKIDHQGDESYKNMWQKSRSIWKYVHHWYKDEFDWFLIGGDDMFIIVENLRKYLSSPEFKDKTKPYFVGRRFKNLDGTIFNSGGASYLLNAQALKILGENIDSSICRPNMRTFGEDVMLAKCLSKFNVLPIDTRNELGEERFHPLTPEHHLRYKKSNDWYFKYSFDLKYGMDCCSYDSVSFHYIKPALMKDIFHWLYTCRIS